METQQIEVRAGSSLSRMLLTGSFNEILVFDALTRKVVEANRTARSILQYTSQELKRRDFRDIFPEADFPAFQSGRPELKTSACLIRRKDGATFSAEARFLAASENGRGLIVAIIQDSGSRITTRNGRRRNESDFQALVSNIPGMAYQAILGEDGSVMLPFVSANSRKLLGVKPQSLQENPALLLDLIVPDDVASYRKALDDASGGHLTFNWEGRIWVEAWKDIKWINIRTSRRETAAGPIWDGIMLNITQSKLAREELERSKEELRRLALHIERVKEAERKRIAREIHDELGGNLTAIKIGVSWLTRNAEKNPVKARERLDSIDEIVDSTLDAIHRISCDLRPSIMDFGIVSALRWQVDQLCRTTGIDCRFLTKLKQVPLDDDASIAVFRIAQEAMTNIAKHARATRAEVHLGIRNRTLQLEIIDNGIGPKLVNSKNRKRSLGVIGMSERASALGGQFVMEPDSGGGTRIRLDIPLMSGKSELEDPSGSSKPAGINSTQVIGRTRR
jgi:signal transduction histidine kinase